MDLDVFMMLDDVNIGKFVKIVKELGYEPRVPVAMDDFADPAKRREWINKNMVVFSVYNPDDNREHVNILLEDKIDFHEAYKRREIIKSGGLTINLISLDGLIRPKEIAGRERDKIDIKALQKIKELRNGK